MQTYYFDVERSCSKLDFEQKDFETEQAAIEHGKTKGYDIVYTENDDGSLKTVWERK